MGNLRNKRIFLADSGKNCLNDKLKGSHHLFFKTAEQGPNSKLLEEIRHFQPDIILGDFWKDKREFIIQLLRSDPHLGNVPIILCTNQEDICTVIRNINGSVNDYMVTPFEGQELKARMERVLHLHQKVLNSNPLSHLPGNLLIKHEMLLRIQKKKTFAVLYFDLDNFKAFNDFYGYLKGDEVIKFFAEFLRNKSEQWDRKGSFLGHIGGDDFILIRPVAHTEEFCQELIEEFDHSIVQFYDEKARREKQIITEDRQGKTRSFPLISLTIAVVLQGKGQYDHPGEISARGSEIKHYLKGFKGSNYLLDRRASPEVRSLCSSKLAI